MTTTRDLCRALGAALQVPGVERYAARLVRDGYLPRAGEKVDEADAAPNPAAVRQRRHRDRRKHGRFVVPVEVTGEMVEANELYKSLTWDRGRELTDHRRFSLATDIDVYFCDRGPGARRPRGCEAAALGRSP